MQKWINYWSKKNIWQDSLLWKKNSIIFFNKTNQFFHYNKQLNILDIGCGNGDFINEVKSFSKKIYGIDISDIFIKICKKKFKKNNNVFIKKYNFNYLKLSKLKIKFDIVICNSVIQYFKSEKDVIKLVKTVKKISKKNTQFLISDIETNKSKNNKFKMIFYSIIDGYFFALIGAFIKNLYSPEYRIKEKKYKLLKINMDKLTKKIKSVAKEVKIISNKRLTTNYSRKHILIKF